LALWLAISVAKAADTQWTVIGAGPAGILSVGLLLDLGVQKKDIYWVDPEFKVGRLGKYYQTVPANLKTKLFVQFLHDCKTFKQCPVTAGIEKLDMCHPEKEYSLKTIVDPLQDITDYLITKVNSKKAMVSSLDYNEGLWHIGLDNQIITSSYVVLATGCHPRELQYPIKNQIPLDIALNKALLGQHVDRPDSVAVIGSAHSAVLILKYLSELNVRNIYNFYKKPLIYVEDKGDWIAHESSGLKGVTAWWAKNILEKNTPKNLKRFKNTPQNRNRWLPICNKIIYAIGYERNELPSINGSKDVTYDNSSGIIGPRLFGIGIAFPEKLTEPDGNKEFRIGLPFFMEYAQKVIPQWITKERFNRLKAFEQLFTIEIL